MMHSSLKGNPQTIEELYDAPMDINDAASMMRKSVSKNERPYVRDVLVYNNRLVDTAGWIDHVVSVDQGSLGRTARGNPATYLGVWDAFRKALSGTPLAKERGYQAGFFSFNVEGGRCETCRGEGAETVEMQFLADVSFLCAVCQGKRFRPEVLAVRHCGVNVAEALALTVSRAGQRLALAVDVAERPRTRCH